MNNGIFKSWSRLNASPTVPNFISTIKTEHKAAGAAAGIYYLLLLDTTMKDRCLYEETI